MKKILTVVIILFAVITQQLRRAKPTKAYIYGAQKVAPQVVVDKKVKPVEAKEWFDNLPQSSNLFTPQDLIDFKIIVRNTGEEDLENLKLSDSLPDYSKLIFGPGEYQEADKKLVWKIDKLAAGETKEFNARIQVEKAEKIGQKQPFCLTNKISVFKDDEEKDSDTAQFCIEPRILGKALPETGFNLIWGSAFASAVIAAGVFARKIGRGELL